jgi:hypothetical protein
MSGPRVLFPLLARPVMLWTLFPLFWAVTIPFILVGEAGFSPDVMRGVILHLGILVPAVFGFAVAIARLEFQLAPGSWTLPGARRGLLTDALAVAMPIAAGSALLNGYLAAAGSVASAGAAAFALAMLSFATAGSAIDNGMPRALRWSALLLLAAAAVRPDALSALTAHAPWPLAIAGSGAAALLFAAHFSRTAARRRHSRWSAIAPGIRTGLYWANRHSARSRWSRNLATDRLGPWLRAAAYEGAGGRRVPLSLQFLIMAALAVLAGYLIASPFQTVLLAGIFLVQGRVRLTSPSRYPLSRARRADIAAAGAALEAAAFMALVVGVTLAVRSSGVPMIAWFADDMTSRFGWPAAIAAAFVWAPVAQWGLVVWPGYAGQHGFDGRRLVLLLLYVVPAFITALLLDGMSVPLLAALAAAWGVAGYGVFWVGARRHFARADLVRATV